MKLLSNDDIRRITNQLDVFYTAFRSSIYYSEVCCSTTIQQYESQFWKYQKYLLLYSLVINWCEVFGAHAKNNHWKEITLENKEYTKLLYDRTNFDYASWSAYRKYVDEIKYTYLVDPDIYHHENAEINLYGIDAVLNITHQWLNDLVNKNNSRLSDEIINKWPIKNHKFSQELREEFRALFNHDASPKISQVI